MLENTVYDRHRHKLLHILCKMCSRGQRTPTSMHIAGCLNREDSEKYRGVNTSVFRGEYKGRPVAIKVLRLYLTSDVDKCLKASALAHPVVEILADTRIPGIFPRSGHMEASPASKHPTIVGCRSRSRTAQAFHDI